MAGLASSSARPADHLVLIHTLDCPEIQDILSGVLALSTFKLIYHEISQITSMQIMYSSMPIMHILIYHAISQCTLYADEVTNLLSCDLPDQPRIQ